MKIGAIYPQTEMADEPGALATIGQAVDSLGYDHLLFYDHVVGAAHDNRDPPLWGPYTDRDPFHDPFVAFGYLAAITQRIDFVTGIMVLPQRQTVLVAKQATDVQLLSNGRLHLGVGAGWNYVEYQALGQDFDTRGPRLSEQIEFLRKLWREPLLDFDGRFHRLDRGNIVPRPSSPIPIYCGGFAEPAYRRAVLLGDGFIFAGKEERVLPGWQRLRELLGQSGRSETDFRTHMLYTDNSRGLPLREALDVLRAWQDAGATHASVLTLGLGLRTAQQHVEYLAELLERAKVALAL